MSDTVPLTVSVDLRDTTRTPAMIREFLTIAETLPGTTISLNGSELEWALTQLGLQDLTPRLKKLTFHPQEKPE